MMKKHWLTEEEFKAALDLKVREIKGEDSTDFEDEGYTQDVKGFLREFRKE